MSDLILGSNADGDVAIDLPVLIESRLLVQANSGAGKSWLLRKLLETTHGHVQQLVLDLEGEFSTLREHYGYIIAGKDGDTPCEPKSAKLLARRLLELGVSAICDLSELPAHDRVRFVRYFCEALVAAPASLRHPVLVVIDEAHHFVPEVGQAESAAAVIDLVTRGRKRGLCAVLATQRLAKVHKDATAELINVLVGRTGQDIDQKRAADILGFSGSDARRGLRDLDPGEFYAFGPAISREVIRFKVGDVLSRHPQVGEHGFTPPPPTDEIRDVLAQLADLPAEAEEEARTVEDLRRQLLASQRELTQAKNAQPPAPHQKLEEITQLETDVWRLQGELRQQEKVVTYLKEQLLQMPKDAADLLSQVADDMLNEIAMKEAIDAETRTAPAGSDDQGAAARGRDGRAPAPPKRPPLQDRPGDPERRGGRAAGVLPSARPGRVGQGEGGSGEAELTGPQRRILNAIAWLESLGIDEPEQTAVAFLADYKYGTGAFNNARGSLRAAGLVEYVGKNIRLTDAGRPLAETPDAPLTNEELHAHVLGRLEGPHQRILQPLLDAWPDAMSNEDLADAARYVAGTGAFNNARGRLRSLGLITYPSPGLARATDLLFPETSARL